MKSHLAVLALAVGLVAAEPAAAQFTPIIARHRQANYRIGPNGQKTVMSDDEGSFLRWSDGTTLVTHQPIVPKMAGVTGIFTDAKTGGIYRVDFSTKTRILRSRRPTPLRLPVDPVLAEKNAIGKAVYNGIPCTLLPVGFGPEMKANSTGLSGVSCWDLKLGIPIYMELDFRSKAGSFETVIENYSIEAGTDPPSASRDEAEKLATVATH